MNLTTLNKKDKETIFLIFLIGGFWTSLDSYNHGLNLDFSSFIGGGLAMVILCIPLGFILERFLNKRPDPSENEAVLDAPKLKIRHSPLSWSIWYGMWGSLVFLILQLIDLIF